MGEKERKVRQIAPKALVFWKRCLLESLRVLISEECPPLGGCTAQVANGFARRNMQIT